MTYQTMDMLELQFPDGAFNAVLSMNPTLFIGTVLKQTHTTINTYIHTYIYTTTEQYKQPFIPSHTLSNTG